MTEFNWDFGPEDAKSVGPDSGFAQLGIVGGAEPQPPSRPEPQRSAAVPPVQASPVSASAQPPVELTGLTRREAREREQAAAKRQRTAHESRPAKVRSQDSRAPKGSDPKGRAPKNRLPKGPRAPRTMRPVRPSRPANRPVAAAAPRQKSLKRRLLSKLMTFGAMAGAGLMMVSTSLPANAFLPNRAAIPLAIEAPDVVDVQSMNVESVAAAPQVTRDSYTAISLREQIFLRYGNRSFAYTNNPLGSIQWPFPIAVPISDGFGYRISPCPGCSSDHKGVDFTPGAGATIQSIADGVVVSVIASHAGLGNHVTVEHQINGQLVQSVYAHMADGTMRVVVGQQVKVTDEIGLVGSTGESTGAHLHLEIHVNGVPVDPFAWLKANAN